MSGYIYRGDQPLTATTKRTTGRKPCGTSAAARAHKRHGEPVDDACRTAYNTERTQTTRTQERETMNQEMMCAINGCGRPSRARGWCGTHYSRWRTHGDPYTVLHPVTRQKIETMPLTDLQSLRESFESSRRKRGIPPEGLPLRRAANV